MEILYRTMFVLGIVAFIAVLIFAENGPSQPFQPTIPTFVNPFDEESSVTYSIHETTAYPDYPTDRIETNGEISFVGCTDNSTDRHLCLSSLDGNESYMSQFVVSGQANGVRFLFNYSNKVLRTLTGSMIRGLKLSIQCQQVTQGPYIPFYFVWVGVSSGSSNIPWLNCPIGKWGLITWTNNSASGYSNPGWYSYNGSNFDAELSSPVTSVGPPSGGVLLFSYLRLDVTYTKVVSDTGCKAPDGAWFPQLDEVACALRGIGDVIWKGLLFVFNGLIYIGGWLVLIGVYIGNGLSVIVWLFNIPGLPSLIQGFVDVILVLWIGIIGFEAFKIVKPFGG